MTSWNTWDDEQVTDLCTVTRKAFEGTPSEELIDGDLASMPGSATNTMQLAALATSAIRALEHYTSATFDTDVLEELRRLSKSGDIETGSAEAEALTLHAILQHLIGQWKLYQAFLQSTQ